MPIDYQIDYQNRLYFLTLEVVTPCCFAGKEKTKMNQYLLSIILLFTCSAGHLCAQSTALRLYTRFSGPIRDNVIQPERHIESEDVFQFYGASIALRRSKDEIRFHEYELGGYFSKNRYPAQELDQEIFFRYQTRLFKPLVDRSWLRMYFSFGPRLFYSRETDNGLTRPYGYPAKHHNYGVELPVILNIDLHLAKKLSLVLAVNTLNTAIYKDVTIIDHPDLTEEQREFSGVGYNTSILNELRFGLGYKL